MYIYIYIYIYIHTTLRYSPYNLYNIYNIYIYIYIYTWLTISSCYGSIPLTLVLIGRDGGLSTLCHSCRFTSQQRVLKTFPGPGFLRSEDGVVWLWHLLVNLFKNLYMHIYIYIYIYIYIFDNSMIFHQHVFPFSLNIYLIITWKREKIRFKRFYMSLSITFQNPQSNLQIHKNFI